MGPRRGRDPHLAGRALALAGTATVEAARRPERTRAVRFPPVRLELSLLALITLGGAALRLLGLGAQSYWSDEAVTVSYTHLPLHRFLYIFIHGEGNPPLYFAAARVWSALFGTGEVGLRSLSALAGAATVPLAYAACSRISKRAALVAAVFVAVNPFLVWYSQEARPYALFAALAAAALACAVRIDEGGRFAAGWAIASALALLTHFFAYPFVLAMGVWLVARRRDRHTRTAVAAVALVAVIVAPAAVLGRADVSWVHGAGPLSARIEAVPVYFLTGLTRLSAPPDIALRFWFAAALACLAFGLVVTAPRSPAKRLASRLVGLSAATALPALAIGAVGAGADYFYPRYLIVILVPLAIVIAIGFTSRRAGLAGAFALAALMLSLTVSIAVRPDLQRANWRAVAHSIGAPHGFRAVVARDGWSAKAMAPYLSGIVAAQSADKRPWTTPALLSQVVLVRAQPAAALVAYRETPLAPGFRLTGAREVGGFLVVTYTAAHPVVTAPGPLLRAAGRVYRIGPGEPPPNYPLLQR